MAKQFTKAEALRVIETIRVRRDKLDKEYEKLDARRETAEAAYKAACRDEVVEELRQLEWRHYSTTNHDKNLVATPKKDGAIVALSKAVDGQYRFYRFPESGSNVAFTMEISRDECHMTAAVLKTLGIEPSCLKKTARKKVAKVATDSGLDQDELQRAIAMYKKQQEK